MLSPVLNPVVGCYREAVQSVVQRCYGHQLMASSVSLTRVLACGGNYEDYRRLQELYADINASVDWSETQRERFWSDYWGVDLRYQPWLVAHLHRTRGLRDQDPFFQDPQSQRIWLYSDVQDLHLPCAMVWDWLDAACPEKLEGAVLLSAFSYNQLYEELCRRSGSGAPSAGACFAAMSIAMVYRMVFKTLAEDFAREAQQWKCMYAAWDLEARLFLLDVLAGIDREESRRYMYAWGPDLFPEASGMLDVARATGTHPATVVRKWYAQRGASTGETLGVEGLV